jgi:hypothetical protein
VVEGNVVANNAYAAVLINGHGRHHSQVINDLIRDNNTGSGRVRGCSRTGVTCEDNT